MNNRKHVAQQRGKEREIGSMMQRDIERVAKQQRADDEREGRIRCEEGGKRRCAKQSPCSLHDTSFLKDETFNRRNK